MVNRELLIEVGQALLLISVVVAPLIAGYITKDWNWAWLSLGVICCAAAAGD